MEPHLFAEIDFLAHIYDGDFLRGGDYDGAVNMGRLQKLRNGDVLIRCPAAGPELSAPKAADKVRQLAEKVLELVKEVQHIVSNVTTAG